jgi:hypothetical protein
VSDSKPASAGLPVYLKTEHFGQVHATNLTPATIALSVSTQRPVNPAALGELFDGLSDDLR